MFGELSLGNFPRIRVKLSEWESVANNYLFASKGPPWCFVISP